jgi:hypothetical protein
MDDGGWRMEKGETRGREWRCCNTQYTSKAAKAVIVAMVPKETEYDC